MKFLKYTAIILFFTILFFANKNNMPTAAEPTSYNYIATAGIDINTEEEIDKRCSLTYKNKDDKSGNETEEVEDKSGEGKNAGTINIKERTIEDVYEKTRTIIKKSFIASRLRHILIGEDTLKDNFAYFIDELSRKKSLRFNTALFFTKGVSAEEFLHAVNLDYDSLEKELEYINAELIGLFSETRCTLKDMMNIYYSEKQTGIIPFLEIIDQPGSNGEKKTFKPGGIGVICEGRLQYYLDYTELRSYIFLNKTVKNSIVDIEIDGGVAAFDIVSSKCDYKFIFNNNKPEKIKIDLSLNTIYLETESKKNEFKQKDFIKLEDELNEKIKDGIEQLIKKSQNAKRDFIGISKFLELKHPYKWHEIKDQWEDIFESTDVEITVKARILHTSNIK